MTIYTSDELFEKFKVLLPWVTQYKHTKESFMNILVNHQNGDHYILDEFPLIYKVYPVFEAGGGFLGYSVVESSYKQIEEE